MYKGFSGVLLGAVMGILLCLFGCGNLETKEEVVGVIVGEAVEVVPAVIANPTMPTVLTAVLSGISGVAGAAFGAAGMKGSVHRKIKDGKLGTYARKTLDMDGSF